MPQEGQITLLPVESSSCRNLDTVGASTQRITLVFGSAVFLGAFLSFAVEPMLAKSLLPWFGGTPEVWTTCLLFFQTLLLAGYVYAHLSAGYLPDKVQIGLHVALLATSLIMLPAIPADSWKPQEGKDPVLRIVLLLTATVGLPFGVLSATGPLLQGWFVQAKPGSSPYRLFALSNGGSLIALVLYPFAIEPLLGLRSQALAWAGGMCVFAIACTVCASILWRRVGARRGRSPRSDLGKDKSGPAVPPRMSDRFLWVALPLVASVLLSATTNKITQEVTPIPFLWVLPLALYLISFVICFDSPRWYWRRFYVVLLALCLAAILRIGWCGPDTAPVLITANVATLFVGCMLCHGELARLKPSVRLLTSYYLAIAAGGALGAMFVVLVAPNLFTTFAELPLALLACVLLVGARLAIDGGHRAALWATPSLCFSLFVLHATMWPRALDDESLIARSRNFYGILSVVKRDISTEWPFLTLIHGRTVHGIQFLDAAERKKPLEYYAEESGIGRVMESVGTPRRHVGIIGLGAGTLAAYGRPGDIFNFYEINPQVLAIARKYFTYLSDSHATVHVTMGDGRLSLERESSQQFDVLVLDAFSSDAIPTHLLTTEAFAVYRKHLRPHGVIAIHITNRHVDLVPPICRLARQWQMEPRLVDFRDENRLIARWILICDVDDFFSLPLLAEAAKEPLVPDDTLLWTDDYVNLLRYLH